MTAEQIVELSRRTIEAAFWVAMPLLLAAMLVGFLINLAQVVTSRTRRSRPCRGFRRSARFSFF
jgi:flagellar biosynthesis protein FliQ